MQDAVIRRIEIIGEGVKNIPEDLKGTRPEIPWRQIARMRDMLIHRYFSVDLDIVWETATVDIPSLRSPLQLLLNDELSNVAASANDASTAPDAQP